MTVIDAELYDLVADVLAARVPQWRDASLKLAFKTIGGVQTLIVTPRDTFCPLKRGHHGSAGAASLHLRQNGRHYVKCFSPKQPCNSHAAYVACRFEDAGLAARIWAPPACRVCGDDVPPQQQQAVLCADCVAAVFAA